MTIRKATSADIDVLMSLWLEMLRAVNALAADFQFDSRFVECARQYFLNGNQTTLLALDEKNQPAGCASVSYVSVMPTFDHPGGSRAHIMNVYVRAPFRRQGIALRMVCALIKEAQEKLCTEISLDATECGRPLYEKIGFKDSQSCMVYRFA